MTKEVWVVDEYGSMKGLICHHANAGCVVGLTQALARAMWRSTLNSATWAMTLTAFEMVQLSATAALGKDDDEDEEARAVRLEENLTSTAAGS
jgi:hypothetical protein